MLKIKEAIIVEGKYDKMKLLTLVDTCIIETGGFRVFKDKERRSLIRRIGESRGIIVFTDSDGAGFVIRNYLNGIVPKNKIKHAYIPEIMGKEKRKDKPSKEGFLGVEGISDEIIINSLKNCGATIEDTELKESRSEITKSDFYTLGLSGHDNSDKLRKLLLTKLELPHYMTANAMLSAFNMIMTKDELESLLKEIKIESFTE